MEMFGKNVELREKLRAGRDDRHRLRQGLKLAPGFRGSFRAKGPRTGLKLPNSRAMLHLRPRLDFQLKIQESHL